MREEDDADGCCRLCTRATIRWWEMEMALLFVFAAVFTVLGFDA